jgi:hypothetical protein
MPRKKSVCVLRIKFQVSRGAARRYGGIAAIWQAICRSARLFAALCALLSISVSVSASTIRLFRESTATLYLSSMYTPSLSVGTGGVLLTCSGLQHNGPVEVRCYTHSDHSPHTHSEHYPHTHSDHSPRGEGI